jgi:hypothetical protein
VVHQVAGVVARAGRDADLTVDAHFSFADRYLRLKEIRA